MLTCKMCGKASTQGYCPECGRILASVAEADKECRMKVMAEEELVWAHLDEEERPPQDLPVGDNDQGDLPF